MGNGSVSVTSWRTASGCIEASWSCRQSPRAFWPLAGLGGDDSAFTPGRPVGTAARANEFVAAFSEDHDRDSKATSKRERVGAVRR